MDQASKRRGRPSPDALNMKPLAFNLEEALAVENIYRPNLLVIQNEIQPWEVTIEERDGAVHILRFLRVWFDVPQPVFFTAVTYLDLFISRMKVQEKYLNCATVACFFCATEKHGCNIDLNLLVTVSQSSGTVKDMLRMAKIVKEKLKLENENDRTTTCADFLFIFMEILEYITTHSEARVTAGEILFQDQLMTRLEVLLTNSSSAFFRSSVLALVLIKLELEKQLSEAIASKSLYFVSELIQLLSILREIQITCKIKSAELMNCSNNASNVLKQYDNEHRIIIPGRIMPTADKGNRHRHFKPLDTIEEKNQKNPQ